MSKLTMTDALACIISLIGNVDHSKGNGPNSALMRGELLNDIRDIAKAAIANATDQ